MRGSEGGREMEEEGKRKPRGEEEEGGGIESRETG